MADRPFITGFCSMGQHEGLKPRSYSGKPMKTCMRFVHDRSNSPRWECKCKCHADIDKMFEMMGMERYIEQNPEYSPEVHSFIMPTLEDRVALSMERATVPHVVIESPAPEHVPATVARAFAPGAAGRARRGELELWVKQTCDKWVIDQPDESCTPAWISEQIADREGVKPPSVGAINAVFERWTKLNFALIGRKPVRFIGYTDEGVKHGLEGLKMRAKLNKSGTR